LHKNNTPEADTTLVGSTIISNELPVEPIDMVTAGVPAEYTYEKLPEAPVDIILEHDQSLTPPCDDGIDFKATNSAPPIGVSGIFGKLPPCGIFVLYSINTS
jgi:hypothetical protein